MDLLETLRFQTVHGNHDRWVAETRRAHMYPSDAFAYDAPHDYAALGARCSPAAMQLADAGIAAVHGTATNDNQYLLEDVVQGRLTLAPPTTIGQRLQGDISRLLLCARSHLPRIVRSADGVLIVN